MMIIQDQRLIGWDDVMPEELVVPEGITGIGARALYGHAEIRSVRLGADVATVGDEAFAECAGLTRVFFPDGVRRLGNGCFRNCRSLRSVRLPDSVVSIHANAFAGCAELTEVRLSQGLRRNIEGGTFADCGSMERIVIPTGIRQIRPGAFSRCVKLREIEFENPDVIIFPDAFQGCVSLPEETLSWISAHLYRDDTVDISSRASGPAGRLSNYTERRFVFDGVPCRSLEGILQSLKCPDEKGQKDICLLTGGWASKAGKAHDWKERQTLYWKGVPYPRKSAAYQELLSRIYDAVFEQDASFREDLRALKGRTIDHSMGLSNPAETVLTRMEFVRQLERLIRKL